jgi:hypothetical protein
MKNNFEKIFELNSPKGSDDDFIRGIVREAEKEIPAKRFAVNPMYALSGALVLFVAVAAFGVFAFGNIGGDDGNPLLVPHTDGAQGAVTTERMPPESTQESRPTEELPIQRLSGFVPTGGIVAEHDGWIYFSDAHSSAQLNGADRSLRGTVNLVKAYPDGSGQVVLDANLQYVSHITVPGDGWVYYWRQGAPSVYFNDVHQGEDEVGIFRIREDGTELTKLSPASVRPGFVITEGRIFYVANTHLTWETVTEDCGNIFSMNTDGSDVVTVVDFKLSEQTKAMSEQELKDDVMGWKRNHALYLHGAADGWVYYWTASVHQPSSWKVSVDGAMKIEAEGEYVSKAYTFFHESGMFGSYDFDNPSVVTGERSYSAHTVVGDSIYYAINDGSVRKIGLDSEEEVVLAQFPDKLVNGSLEQGDIVHNITVFGERVYMQITRTQLWGLGHYSIWAFDIVDGEVAVPVFLNGIVV